MNKFKNISTTLSIASALLLGACSSGSGGDSGSDDTPEPVTNTKAPQLIGSWATSCIMTESGTSTSTGASGGGSGGITGGAAFIDTVNYDLDGQVQFTTENFATSNCNTNTSTGVERFEGVYFVGNAGFANDGSPITTIDYSDSDSTNYSIFQIVNDNDLFLGNQEESTPGNEGSSASNRLDGLGSKYDKN